jgi:hypothetical protein
VLDLKLISPRDALLMSAEELYYWAERIRRRQKKKPNGR